MIFQVVCNRKKTSWFSLFLLENRLFDIIGLFLEMFRCWLPPEPLPTIYKFILFNPSITLKSHCIRCSSYEFVFKSKKWPVDIPDGFDKNILNLCPTCPRMEFLWKYTMTFIKKNSIATLGDQYLEHRTTSQGHDSLSIGQVAKLVLFNWQFSIKFLHFYELQCTSYS